MGGRKTTDLSLLPEEIVLFQILPKVPGKSLLRFRCVCKQWLSFLTSPLFTKIHLHHVTTTTTNNEKVVFFIKGSHNFQTLDCHEDGLTDMPRCYPLEGGSGSLLATPVNGLLLVLWISRFSSNMILWNPLTSEYKTIPSPPFDLPSFISRTRALGLYHTCSDDDYKILCITIDRNVYIYSLKSDSWRKLNSTLDFLERIPYAADANLLEEKLHFLTALRGNRYMITRLDLKTEKFTKIAVPPGCEPPVEMKLAVVRGCIELTVFGLRNTRVIEMWQMNARGWTKMMSISYSRNHNPMHPMSRRSALKPLYLMRNGNFIGCTVNGVYKVDPDKKAEDELYSNPNIAIYHPPQIYTETFVSPNQYVS